MLLPAVPPLYGSAPRFCPCLAAWQSLRLSFLRFRSSICGSFLLDRLFLRAPPPLTPLPPLSTVHGQFSVAVRGCGSGLPGKNDRGLDLYGLLAFIQLQQCAQDRCNAKINLSTRALNPAGRWRRSARPAAEATRAEPLGVITSWAREKAARAGGGATLGGGAKRSRRDFIAAGPSDVDARGGLGGRGHRVGGARG